MATSFTINGKAATTDAPPATPLLWVIREGLKLTGTKFGCGIGMCGACTVHLNGQAARSCQLPVSAISGQKIVTIEGLAENASHPLQQSWMELDVPQCGYCQSGQIMSAAALLANNPHPSDVDIDGAMTGNLCRCATYTRIRAGIHRAAEMSASKGAGK